LSLDQGFFGDVEQFNARLAKFALSLNTPEAQEIKTRLELVRQKYPSEHLNNLDGRLRDFGSFRGAVWELFLFEQLLNSEIHLEVEVAVDGKPKSIDFVWDSGNRTFCLEATSRSHSQGAIATDLMQNELLSYLDASLQVQSRLVHLNVTRANSVRPDFEYVRSAIEKFHSLREIGAGGCVKHSIEDVASGWRFEVTFGVDVSVANGIVPIVLNGTSYEELSLADLRESIECKFSKFGHHGKFANVLAFVGEHLIPPNTFSTVKLLYGEPALRVAVDDSLQSYILENPGVFALGNSKYSHVAAVVIGSGLLPGFSSYRIPMVCLNPNASNPLSANDFPINAEWFRFNEDHFESRRNDSKWQHMGLLSV
jgi:hypothetical protein